MIDLTSLSFRPQISSVPLYLGNYGGFGNLFKKKKRMKPKAISVLNKKPSLYKKLRKW